MAKITYVEHGGKEHVVEVANGLTVMEGARDNGIPGIEADCGGACACATCHVEVDGEWLSKLHPANDDEEAMLDQVPLLTDGSRLSCQIIFTPELAGLQVRLVANG